MCTDPHYGKQKYYQCFYLLEMFASKLQFQQHPELLMDRENIKLGSVRAEIQLPWEKRASE